MEDPSSLGVVVRSVLSFLAVLGLLLLGARLLRRMGTGTRTRGGAVRAIEVVDRQGLGRNTALVVVQVAGVPLVLGVSEQQVNVLAELDAENLRAHLERPDDETGERSPTQMHAALQTLRDLTVRRG